MDTELPLILIVGAADTGRAPIGAALLRRMLGQRGLTWRIASAGVVGHDREAAQPEARDASAILGLDLSEHQARSLNATLAAEARLLIATDSGIARVIRLQYPQATTLSLGELADRQRDIPDPFRMQMGAWLSYAHEIELLLMAGLDRLITLVMGEVTGEIAPPLSASSPVPIAPYQHAAIDRALRLLHLLSEMPGTIDWPGTRRQIETDLLAMLTALDPDDLARPYIAMLQAMLTFNPQPPIPSQIEHLCAVLETLRTPITADHLTTLAAMLARYPLLG